MLLNFIIKIQTIGINKMSSRICCPECNEMILLDDTLNCIVCEGQYKWVSKKTKEMKYE